ncbi:hypothetical protein [Terricaulis silvestris]|uniref:Uncharacterized protein n=1 Tax=Terricaulis silvestris TaxID=2686094 RepID=A0A6I6MIH7_9CAUL|nr:hypothetical protein [Terricaulis silvestris]QGZ94900.1 hypothetical protein DSM104635_01735 [Terricaulis silvestris]
MLSGFLALAFLGLFLEATYRLLAVALLWLAPILAALAAMQVTLERHPTDPGQVFWAFIIGALGVRFLIGCLAYAAGVRTR